ncbi:OprD family outer membrane porin [Acinetobacter tianfuensis]|uniref:Outer membrane porin, OprD family n=1 Tax=Acinetobacter tianfuensis TaxID=2419603 RepID=A0A3A8E8X3_9GAMM|nr:OprD family outer membrane porin [Acinetobacter tianfuensis]RKG30619.1 outer membrane porin, OprD family [Acinetobacter tianfuensis]
MKASHKTKLLSLAILSFGLSQTAMAEDHWKLFLKNAYIDRDFDNDAVKDTGSWSQSVSLFYDSKFQDTPIDQLQIGLDANVQYAVRLSNDKHVADSVLPFDSATQEQASDYAKFGGAVKLKYKDNVLKVGEIWADSPVANIDASRQLVGTYLGGTLSSVINDQLSLELGVLTKYSARNDDQFKKLSYTQNGNKIQSDGMNYIDLKYRVNDQLKAAYSFVHLDNIFNKHYVSLEHNYAFNADTSLNSKVRYYNVQDTGSQADIDSQNIGVLETVKYKNHTVSAGVQKIVGDAFPALDGYIPELYFVNWNVTGFFKKNEQTYHLIYGYNFKDYVPGLNALVKYSYGEKIKMAGGIENTESELDVIGSYSFQNEYLKGVGLQYLFAKYDTKYGNDFDENRFFVTYTKKF